MRINHNIAALNTHRQLGQANNMQQNSMEKLSSGLRINKAGDDAAGLAISEKMRGQIRGLDQAQRNAQDGISMIQTAEGAMNETHSILQRMRELAVQSSNDTNTDSDRAELQKEVDQLAKEVTRISNDTEFNTQTLLNGGIASDNLGEAKFQIGANKGQNISLEIGAMDASTLGVARNVTTTTGTVNGTGISNLELGDTLGAAVVDGANVTFNSANNTGVTPGQVTTGGLTFDFSSGSALNGWTVETGTVGDGTAVSASLDTTNKKIVIDGDFTTAGGAIVTSSALQTEINNALSGGGFTQTATVGGTATDGTTTGSASAAISGGVDGNALETIITVSDGTGGNTQKITVNDTDTSVSISSGAFQGISFDVADATALTSGDDTIDIAKTIETSAAASFAADGTTTDATVGGGIDISTQAAADSAITKIDGAIESVSAERSKLGAVQNRLDHTINNLGTSSENLTAAESRIRDVDYALAA